MRSRVEGAIGIAFLLAALFLALRREGAPPGAPARSPSISSSSNQTESIHPAKSHRHPGKQDAPAAASNPDHVAIAEILIAGGNIQAAREHLDLAIDLDDTDNEAQFLRDTLSDSFRPLPGRIGSESGFWRLRTGKPGGLLSP